MLARVRVEHELSDGAVQMGDGAAHERKARARELRRGVEVEAERSADVDMILHREIEDARRAPAAHFDVFGFVLADRGGGMGKIRNAQKHRVQLRADLVELGFKRRETGRNFRSLLHGFGGVLAGLLQAADFLRNRVAFGLQLFGLGLNGLAARFKFIEFGFRENEIAGLETGRDFGEILAQKRDVEHLRSYGYERKAQRRRGGGRPSKCADGVAAR